MTGDTIECFNCGHANPSWAQVCRSCGAPIRPDGPAGSAPRGIFPTDQASLISIGGAVGAIVLAIVFGLLLSGIIPAIPAATPSPTPSASASASASVSGAPSVVESAPASVVASPALPGTIVFGTGWDNTTKQITGETTAFTAASAGFAHSISLSEPIGVDRLLEDVVRIADDGAETVVQQKGVVLVNPALLTDGLESSKTVAQLIEAWGKGTFILQVFRGGELLAEGSFTFS